MVKDVSTRDQQLLTRERRSMLPSPALLFALIFGLTIFFSTYLFADEHLSNHTNKLKQLLNTDDFSEKYGISAYHQEIESLIYESSDKDLNLTTSEINLGSAHPDYRNILSIIPDSHVSPVVRKYAKDHYILKVLDQNTVIDILADTANYNIKNNKNNALVFTGTYTSSLDKAVGIFAVDGYIINPAVREWNGLLLIRNNQVKILNARNIPLDTRYLDITSSVHDLAFFMRWLKEHKASVIQSHLLLHNGEIAARPRNKLLRRRALFADGNGIYYVYDSLEQKMDLHTLAKLLKEKYAAKHVLNLDMGSYDYCFRYENKQLSKIGELDHTSKLSNLIQITWK